MADLEGMRRACRKHGIEFANDDPNHPIWREGWTISVDGILPTNPASSDLDQEVDVVQLALATHPRIYREPMRTRLIYGDWCDSLVFLGEGEVFERIRLFQALRVSRTWGEFRCRVDRWRYHEALERVEGAPSLTFEEFYVPGPDPREQRVAREIYDRFGLGERVREGEPFSADSIYGIGDGDWPEWPAQEMLHWIPENIQETYGQVLSSGHSGEVLQFDTAREEEIVEAMRAAGFCVRRNDTLIEAAHGSWEGQQ